MMKALKETAEMGLTRIEVTYYADTREAENQLLASEFSEIIHRDLDLVNAALNSIDGLCYQIPMISLL